jgi:DNA replication protein DnaT
MQPWMKMELDTPDKPEVHQMAEILNIDPDAVVGKLTRVWGWFNKNSINGIEPTSTVRILNRLVFNKNFCDAMIKVNWMAIDKRSNTIKIPKFDLHNSKGAKRRALGALRQETHRAKKHMPPEPSNAKVTLTGSLEKSRLDDITLSPSSAAPSVVYVPKPDSKELDYEQC